jgi:hypothetical protein
MKDHIRLFFVSGVLILSVLIASSVNAEVYKSVDENGNVVYTDQRPDADAVPMELPGLSIISAQKSTTQSPAARARAEAVAVEGQAGEEVVSIRDLRRGYRDFAIIHPIPDQVFIGTGNEVGGVAWDTRFALQQGMTVTVFLDGVAQEPTTAPLVDVGWLARGAHEVRAELKDRRNRHIASTDPVTFHVRQPSVNSPNRQ